MTTDPTVTEQECMRYGFTQVEWGQARRIVRSSLTWAARRSHPLTYWKLSRDLVEQLDRPDLGSLGDPVVWEGLMALIVDVSTESYVERGVLLGALAVSRGSSVPTGHLFDLAKKLGAIPESTSWDDQLAWWTDEVRRARTAYRRAAE